MRVRQHCASRALLALLAVMASGCRSLPEPPQGDDGRTPQEISALISEADRLYKEPRDAPSVRASLSYAEKAFTEADAAGARWRAARACAWLATYLDDVAERQHYAEQGVAIGEVGVATSPESAPTHYYHALNLGLLSEITNSGLFRIKLMRQHSLRTIELDEHFHYAGGHRFLGILCYRTSNIPLFAAGSAKDAERHLRRALELFPEHGENLLALAEFHAWQGEPALALPLLKQLEESTPPPDLAAEHEEWKRKGRGISE